MPDVIFVDTTEKVRRKDMDSEPEVDYLEEYLPPPEVRAQRHMERRPVLGQPFPYNSEVCELPPEMMFMHEVIYGEGESVDNVDVWDQMKKEVVPELDKMWEIVKELRARVEVLENDLGRVREVAPGAGTESPVATAGQGQAERL